MSEDWVNCPICGEPDMQQVTDSEGNPLISCTNITCASNGGSNEELARAKEAREHTHDWYRRHYGKLHEWARKRLPEPWRTEFFNCIANGTWGHDDVGEPYMSQVGRIVPSGYFKMDDAAKQLLHDQTIRAEKAEYSLKEVKEALRECLAALQSLDLETDYYVDGRRQPHVKNQLKKSLDSGMTTFAGSQEKEKL
jgi:hypothetical protein